jgi:hypothetical protein
VALANAKDAMRQSAFFLAVNIASPMVFSQRFFDQRHWNGTEMRLCEPQVAGNDPQAAARAGQSMRVHVDGVVLVEIIDASIRVDRSADLAGDLNKVAGPGGKNLLPERLGRVVLAI